MSTDDKKIHGVKKKRIRPNSWISSRRSAIRRPQEKRKSPRTDCDCPAIIGGYSFKAMVTDISLSGCFVECDSDFAATLGAEKNINLAVKFATEDRVLDFQIKVIRAGKHGMACQFVALRKHEMEALQRFFDFAKETQPLF